MNREEAQEGYQRVRDYLVAAVTERVFEPGARLPTERELSEQFEVSRTVTRRALAELEGGGMIQRHVGRGTFVRPAAQSQVEEVSRSLAEGVISPADYIEARLRFEPEMAWMVVSNARSEDFAQMDACLKRSERATTREEFELHDAAFHQTVAAATHNMLAIGVYAMIHSVRHQQAMWGKLRERGQTTEQRVVFQSEHREILDALKARDAEGARALMSHHIRATRRRLLDI